MINELCQSEESLSPPKRTPVLLITDLGLDIDDTFALFLLLGARDVVDLKAVVTSLNRTDERAALVREYIRYVGIKDEDLEVLPGPDAKVTTKTLNGAPFDCSGAFESNPRVEKANLKSPELTPGRILEICKQHEEEGIIIMGIGSLSALHEAIKLDESGVEFKDGKIVKSGVDTAPSVLKNAVKRIYLQGHVNFTTRKIDVTKLNPESPELSALKCDPAEVAASAECYMIPGYNAFNYMTDLPAAKKIYEYFQTSVPFTIMGKFAAYRVKVQKQNLKNWSKLLNAVIHGKAHVNRDVLYHISKRGLIDLRHYKPVSFRNAHPNAPQKGRADGSDLVEWFDKQENSYGMAAAFDPLLALVLVLDLRGDNEARRAKQLFTRYSFKPPLSAVGKEIEHEVFGNSSTKNSIPNPGAVHKILVDHISKGMQIPCADL